MVTTTQLAAFIHSLKPHMASEASGNAVSKQDDKELKTSLMNEAKAMNSMLGKDKKGDQRAQGMQNALDALAVMIPEDGGDGGKTR
jgi:hypothetical protein